MFYNDFSVRVVGGIEDANGYVEMNHGQTYLLSMRNNRSVKCDASVIIDGEYIGTWRIEPKSSVSIDRLVEDDGQLTFYKEGSEEARKAMIDSNDSNMGLVAVTFTPDKPQARWINPKNPRYYIQDIPWGPWPEEGRIKFTSSSYSTASAPQGYTGGGTGLSGKSNQEFSLASALENPDYEQETTINLRLVTRDDGPRPLPSKATKVPPRV